MPITIGGGGNWSPVLEALARRQALEQQANEQARADNNRSQDIQHSLAVSTFNQRQKKQDENRADAIRFHQEQEHSKDHTDLLAHEQAQLDQQRQLRGDALTARSQDMADRTAARAENSRLYRESADKRHQETMSANAAAKQAAAVQREGTIYSTAFKHYSDQGYPEPDKAAQKVLDAFRSGGNRPGIPDSSIDVPLQPIPTMDQAPAAPAFSTIPVGNTNSDASIIGDNPPDSMMQNEERDSVDSGDPGAEGDTGAAGEGGAGGDAGSAGAGEADAPPVSRGFNSFDGTDTSTDAAPPLAGGNPGMQGDPADDGHSPGYNAIHSGYSEAQKILDAAHAKTLADLEATRWQRVSGSPRPDDEQQRIGLRQEAPPIMSSSDAATDQEREALNHPAPPVAAKSFEPNAFVQNYPSKPPEHMINYLARKGVHAAATLAGGVIGPLGMYAANKAVNALLPDPGQDAPPITPATPAATWQEGASRNKMFGDSRDEAPIMGQPATQNSAVDERRIAPPVEEEEAPLKVPEIDAAPQLHATADEATSAPPIKTSQVAPPIDANERWKQQKEADKKQKDMDAKKAKQDAADLAQRREKRQEGKDVATTKHLTTLEEAQRDKMNPFKYEEALIRAKTQNMPPQDAAAYAQYEAAKLDGEPLPQGTNKFQDQAMLDFADKAKANVMAPSTAMMEWRNHYRSSRNPAMALGAHNLANSLAGNAQPAQRTGTATTQTQPPAQKVMKDGKTGYLKADGSGYETR